VCPLAVWHCLVRPLPIHPCPVCPLPAHSINVWSSPLADTLGGLFCCGLQRLDNYSPQAKWVTHDWLILHHHPMYVTNCDRFGNEDMDTIRILDFQLFHRTMQEPKLQMWVNWADLVTGRSMWDISPVGIHSNCLASKWSLSCSIRTSHLGWNLAVMKISLILYFWCSLMLCLMPQEVGFYHELGGSFADCRQQHTPG